jgi:hypothetical protein
LASLAVVAAAPRVWLLASSVDVWGDGPTRAAWAYAWARAPSLVTHGMWLPGLVYVAGPLTFAFHPLLACRLVSLACGIATVPLLFALVSRAYGYASALVAALLLAFLPLHAELSATALSEVPGAFALLAAWTLAARADESDRPGLLRAGAITCALWAALIRYETWLVLPFFTIIDGRRSGMRARLVRLAVLALVPLTWTIGNYRDTGDPLYGFTMALNGAALGGARPLHWSGILHVLSDAVLEELGWVLTLALVLGVFMLPRVRPTSTRASRWLLALCAVEWTFALLFASRRGTTMYPRYLLVPLVVSLPLVSCTFAAMRSRRAVALMLIVLALGTAQSWRKPWHYLIVSVPPDVHAFVTWLRDSPYAQRYVLMTSIDWKTSYVAMEWPEAIERQATFSAWTSDAELESVIARCHPALLVTAERDDDLRKRVEHVLGRTLPTTALSSFGEVRVYELDQKAACASVPFRG